MVINYENDECEDGILSLLDNKADKYAIKSKTASRQNGVELTIEVRLKEMKTAFIDEIYKISGVSNVVMVSYNGDYMG